MALNNTYKSSMITDMIVSLIWINEHLSNTVSFSFLASNECIFLETLDFISMQATSQILLLALILNRSEFIIVNTILRFF